MMIFKTTLTTILAVAMILGGVFSPAEGITATVEAEADNTLDKVIEYAASNASGEAAEADDVQVENVSPVAEDETDAPKAEKSSSESETGTEEQTTEVVIPVMPSETNSFVSNYYIDEPDQDAPFFESVLPIIKKYIKEYNKHSVTPYYDKFPVANNPENFQGLGSSTYENINGKTVTAEAFYRVAGDSLHDPNNGMGLLLFQCIQYKLAHPEEDVKITYSSYRTSVTASVCVIPESKYYGYMRSLYGTNYDEQGFVRISYMLVEAARMGIEVTMVNHLPSYSVRQYDPVSGTLKSRSHINYKTYFAKALETSCYDKWVGEGKKVSDYLNCVNVDWTVDINTQNMQHVKGLSVSHYLATDGTEHTSGVFFCTSNLDENDYRGCNGNGYSQSGVIISDHDELFRINYNYAQLMTQYASQDGINELHMRVEQMNNEQVKLINMGLGHMIPSDKQIVYLGSETDKVFELYFTPIGGGTDVWDTTYNPLCKYASKLPESEGYVEYASNQYGFGKFYVGYILQRMLERAFCENPDPNNKIAVQITDFNVDKIKELQLGTEIGYCKLDTRPVSKTQIHAKDHLMSYVEDGQRHYVSIMTSCNLYMIAFNYRTNSILVIHETEQTGNGFYTALGNKFTGGMIK